MACYIRSERSLQLKHFRYLVESFVIHPQRTPVLLMPFFTGCANDRQQIDGVCTECRILPKNRFGTAFYDDRKLLPRFLTEVNQCLPSHVCFAEVHQVDKWDATQIEAQQEEVAGKIELTVLTRSASSRREMMEGEIARLAVGSLPMKTFSNNSRVLSEARFCSMA